MKVLIFVSCALAVTSAGWAPIHLEEHHEEYHDEGHGLETLSESHGHHEQAFSHQEVNRHYDHHHEHDVPKHHSAVIHPVTIPHHTHPAYETSHTEPLVDHHGKPLDTPEVELAKAKHFIAVHEALSRTAPHDEHSYDHHYRKRRSIEDYFEHQDHNELLSHDSSAYGLEHEIHGFEINQVHAPIYGHHESYHHYEHTPVIDHEGHPVDTPEVEAAKAAHFAAHREAVARNLYGHGHIAGHDVPEDTPEVQHARAEHLAAHAVAKAQAHHY